MTIIPRCEEALKAYAVSRNITGLNVYRGMGRELAAVNTTSSLKIENPSLTCSAPNARRDPDIKGNWIVNASVMLRLNAPDVSEDDVRTWCGTLSEHFETDTLAADINEESPTGFTATGIELEDAGYRINGKVWEIFLTMLIYCLPDDVT